jgi:hypothetical protein
MNSHPTLSILRNFTFLNIPTIFIQPNDLLYSLSFPLTYLVPGMPRGPLIHGAPAALIVLRHMRSNVHPAEFSHEFPRVVVLVPCYGHPFLAGDGGRLRGHR